MCLCKAHHTLKALREEQVIGANDLAVLAVFGDLSKCDVVIRDNGHE
jgi:hypothetical protein